MSEKEENLDTPCEGLAISVRKARKIFRSWNDTNMVLNNLNMSVKKGCLYALLGASGCGKTTLLKCIIGRELLDAGEILVFGGVPGSKKSGVPGPRTEALLSQFTVYETLLYFGMLAGIERSDVMVKADELIPLLQLKNPNQLVGSLSGGEKRRISLAVSLLHEPELLILDEPTVGLDPLLREIIWKLLTYEITKGTTIVITTHYIEEANLATVISLMRRGEILAEKSPEDLLNHFHCDSLELTFVELSKIQDDENLTRQTEVEKQSRGNKKGASVLKESPAFCKLRNLKVLVWKNSLWLRRSIWTAVQLIFFTVILSTLVNNTIGLELSGLKLAIMNNEYPGAASCPFNNTCTSNGLSCKFLHHLSKTKHILEAYKERQCGLAAVRHGKFWLFLEIPSNFSESFYYGLQQGWFSRQININNSRIEVTMDMSDYTKAYLLQLTIIRSFNEFLADVARSCGYSPSSLKEIPIKFNEPIYGYLGSPLKDSMLPGLLLLLLFILMITLSTSSILIERKEGIWERSFVAGVTAFEIVISHFIIQLILLLVSALVILTVTLVLFNAKNNGSVFIICLFLLMAGILGICYGTLISCVFTNEFMAVFFLLSTFIPFLFISGVWWPWQGQHFLLKYPSLLAPFTLATQSLRSVMIRGWGLEAISVWYGLIAQGVWIGIFILATFLVVKFKIT